MDVSKSEKPSPWYKKLWIIIPIGIFVAPVVVITFIAMVYGIFSAVSESAEEQKPSQQKTQESEVKPSARGYVDEKQIIAQNRVQFIGAVLNTGEITSSFTCYAEASGANDELMGSALVRVPEIKPGEYYSYNVDFETDKPANLVVYSRLTCE